MDTSRGKMTRRDVVQRSAGIGVGVATAGMFAGAPGMAAALRRQDGGEGNYGGRLRVGIMGEPPTLDEHQTTAGIVAEVTYPMYETLFTYDANYQAIPMLVETHTMSEDGLTHTMKLREGITFHNGEPMTAADVHASVTRWAQISGVGSNLFEAVDEFVEVDEHTVEFRLSRPYGTILIALAHNTQACTIHPKAIMEEAGTEPLSRDEQLIGTGPYMLSARQADAYIRQVRFEDYVSRDEPINGYGGAKYAYVDEIEFIPVPDEAARVAGLQAGDYEIALEISNDQYELLRETPGVVAQIQEPTNFEVFFLNWRSPLMSNLALRQAFQAALAHEPILTAARGGDPFTRLDPGWMMQQTTFHTTAGEEHYNVNDPELARQKLEEAGYDGTPVRFMTTQEYPQFYSASVIAQQQLEAVGFTIDLQVIDWATLIERRAQEDEWDVFCTSHGFVPDPSQITLVGQMGVYPGWYDSEESLALAEELLAEQDFETRYSIWEELQRNIYTEIPAIKVGDAASASYFSERLGNWIEQVERGVPYWNLWLEDA
ncbi:MAG TPA: ABC transporter substrate-binding protein [Thermomicrobiales bacterium]|nr:ABC transporter substrate-binding protein [Thermomicrobiales bacterium]